MDAFGEGMFGGILLAGSLFGWIMLIEFYILPWLERRRKLRELRVIFSKPLTQPEETGGPKREGK